MARAIDADALSGKIREYMADYPNATARLTACRAVLSMLGDEKQTPTVRTDHIPKATKITPLTLEQLREMDEPVWVACKPIEAGDGYWCFCRYGHITTPGGSFFEVVEIPHWVFYRRPPEGEGN